QMSKERVRQQCQKLDGVADSFDQLRDLKRIRLPFELIEKTPELAVMKVVDFAACNQQIMCPFVDADFSAPVRLGRSGSQLAASIEKGLGYYRRESSRPRLSILRNREIILVLRQRSNQRIN